MIGRGAAAVGRGVALVAVALAAVACADSSDVPTPFFPANYAETYTEVRDCRSSGDHDLNMVRMLADPNALAPYQEREDPFPVGSVVLKEEFEFGDEDCTGPIKQWTVMQKLEPGSAPETLDWSWQRVDSARQVVGTNEQRCISCHTGCGVAPDGYDGTCATPE